MAEATPESDEFATGLAVGVETILDGAADFTTDELIETRDNLLALFYSHLDDLRASSAPPLAVEQASELVGDDITYWLSNQFMTPDMLGEKVAWWISRALTTPPAAPTTDGPQR